MRLAAIAALIAMTGSAAAQMIPRAEDGSVRYELSSPMGLDEPLHVRPGDVAWTEYIRPARLVRTTSDGINRPGRLHAPAVPAGSILFEYTLRGGAAYCPVIARGDRRVQCYRDLDADGTFDGGYVTISRGIDSVVLPGGLRGLRGMPRVSYEPADVTEGPVVSGQVVFTGFSRGSPRFRIRIEQEWLEGDDTCQLDENAQCQVYDVLLRVLPLGGDRARIELIDAAPERVLTVCFESSAPGDGCR